MATKALSVCFRGLNAVFIFASTPANTINRSPLSWSRPGSHVVLARSGDANLTQKIVSVQLDSIELGPLKSNRGDQNYDLPAPVDLQRYNAVVIYCERFHAIFGLAKLEKF
jgi:hypothetical protein